MSTPDGERGLPPLIASVAGTDVTWARADATDFKLVGYFLACHLAVEHYLDGFLAVFYPNLGWGRARLTFAQKAKLLSGVWSEDVTFDSMPAIKHMNAVRNRLGHQLNYTLTDADMLPFVHYLERLEHRPLIPTDKADLLEVFTSLVCVSFAGNISRRVRGVV